MGPAGREHQWYSPEADVAKIDSIAARASGLYGSLVHPAQQAGPVAGRTSASRVALAATGSSKATYQPIPGFAKTIPRVILPHDTTHPAIAANRKRTETTSGRKEEGINKPQDKQDPSHDPNLGKHEEQRPSTRLASRQAGTPLRPARCRQRASNIPAAPLGRPPVTSRESNC
jgi:hypothetical protein